MDNLSEKQQKRLLTEALYSSWLARWLKRFGSKCRLVYALRQPPLVLMFSWMCKFLKTGTRTPLYFFWEFGKTTRGSHRNYSLWKMN